MLLPEPMYAKATKRIPTGRNWWMEAKYDGIRILAGVLGRVGLWTRSGNPITQVPYIEQAILERFPLGTILDGEIVDLRTGRQWNRASSILSKSRGGYQHQPTATDPPLTYVIFDILQAGERDVRRLPLSERRKLLEEMCAGLNGRGDQPLMLIHTHAPTDEGLKAILDLGFEGVVCKREDSPYLCGDRRGAWVKIKPRETLDAEFIGVYEPKPGSRYALPQPWAVGGVRFRLHHDDGRIYEGRAAGMDDQLRAELWQHPERYAEWIVELNHWGVQDSGALRFPQVVRLRHPTDKTLAHGKPATPKRAAKRESAPGRSDKPWMRNYGAMTAENRRVAVESLRAGSGDAYEKCVQRGGDPTAHLRAAEDAVHAKGDPLP
jgi:bifunctional non-homologous end joining protein LigD